MLNLVSLLVAAALVSLHCSYEADAAIEHPKIIVSNNLEPNSLPAPRRRLLREYLTISEPPPATVKQVSGTPLVLPCVAYGKPAPSISWLKNGVPVSDFEEDSNEVFAVHPSSIARIMSKLVVPSATNGDVFTCVANSGVIEKTASSTVYTEEVQDDVLSLPAEPVITASYGDVLQVMGSSVTLPCRTYSATDSKLYWIDNNGNPVYDNQRFKTLPSGDLRITGLVFEDMGDYTCTVKNLYGEDSSTTFLYPFRN
ncbi:neural/ectodermal development factor IMP-L2-like [Colias croceus]|uniref:neural/ectodermal development factor IMP-L2-like n=1 Tax=Colias crocea TaxID=72248 RepID=UPI001E27C6FC|nr:neural/ectodermal development factor IMP-L2-like [Colias croceus]XP_045507892.1 neural/ectodermal development factor IMP-L2-like [Colias croceus]